MRTPPASQCSLTTEPVFWGRLAPCEGRADAAGRAISQYHGNYQEAMKSKNRVINFFSSRRHVDGTEEVPPHLHNDPTWVPRLGFKPTDGTITLPNLASTIAGLPSSVAVFLDNNIWDLRLEHDVWPALLSTGATVYVIPSVRLELEAWRLKNSEFIGSQAVANGQNLILLDLPEEGPNRVVFTYYVSLLRQRRNAFDFYSSRFEEIQGRAPSQTELVEGVQRLYGQRGLSLVRKGGEDAAKDKWFADEALVFSAAWHSLCTGEPTIILTLDQDVLDQFYKLWWFLDTHYRGMLLAEEYASDPTRYPRLALPDTAVVRNFFNLGESFLISRGSGRMREVLPKPSPPVVPECWLLNPNRGTLTRLSFCADREMIRLLQEKGATGGLVSSLLGGHNLHPYLGGTLLERVDPTIVRDCVAIVEDSTTEVGDGLARLAYLDITYALFSNERFTRMVSADGP